MNYISSCFTWISCVYSASEVCKCLQLRKLFKPKERTYRIDPINDITYKINMIDINTFRLDPLNDIIVKVQKI
jgi:hypothetical protein